MTTILRNGRPGWLAATAFSAAACIVGLLILHVFRSVSGAAYPHASQMAHMAPPAARAWARDPREYVLDTAGWDVRAPPQRRYHNWTLTEVEANPDGVFRTVFAVNAQFPGPLVEANEGDTIVVDVHNRLTNSTSLHWHGLPQNGTGFMDGTVGVTSCAIPPGASFRYEFAAALAGTYWYHAHFSTARTDGLFGPLIVHARAAPRVAGSDRIVMVQDWYHDLSAALLPRYLAPGNENAEPVPNGALINGRGRTDCARVGKAYRCDPAGVALEVLHLDPAKPHKLRFINVGALAEFDVDVDEHAVSLVEVDGVAVVPHTFHRLRINVAQRYSVVVPARTAAAVRGGRSSFWLRARMLPHCFAAVPDALQLEVRAIVSYAPPSLAPTRPESRAWDDAAPLECLEMNLTSVAPLHALPAAPPTADLLVRLRSSFAIGAYQLSRGFFNDTSWRPQRTPTLLQAIAGLAGANASLFSAPPHASPPVLDRAYDVARQLVVMLDRGAVVDLLIDNYDDGNHPFHLHGHKFWVLGAGTGYLDTAAYARIDATRALRRDTVTVEAFGWALLRFVADNPGMWALHCHLAWHAEAGMLMQFLVDAETVGSWTVPAQVEELCSHPERQRGGPIADDVFYW